MARVTVHSPSDLHEFFGHEGSGGAVFVVEQVSNVRGLFLVFQQANDLLGFGLGQFAHHVRRVVRVQVLQYLLRDFFRGHRTEQIRTLLFVQFYEYIGLGFVVKEAEQVARVVEIQPVDDLGDVRRVQFLQRRTQLGIFSGVDALIELLQVFFCEVEHGTALPQR